MHYTILARNMAAPPHSSHIGSLDMSFQWIEQPTDTDVLLGRGVATNRHPGNENFRGIIGQHVDVYVSSTKKQKMMISRSIVDMVRKQLVPPGRFLEKNMETGLWSEVGDKKALEKTAQALRDGAAPLRKQLSEDMSDPDFLSAVFDDGDVDMEPDPVKSKSHRRMQSAPVRQLTLPPEALPRAKKRCSKADLAALTPMECLSQIGDEVNITPSQSPPINTSPFHLSLSPLRTGSPKGSDSSTGTSRSRQGRGSRHHRRHRTFGGYSCSDSNAASFLTKEDLQEGIPPLFASQLQPPQPPPLPQTPQHQMEPLQWPPPLQHPLVPRQSPPPMPHLSAPIAPLSVPLAPLSAPIAPLSAPFASPQSTPEPVARPPIRTHRHRRYNTMGSASFTRPVFSDDPTLTFTFPTVEEERSVEITHSHHSPASAHPVVRSHIPDFSLEIPDLPLPPLHPNPPSQKPGRGHRRMHTTGHFSVSIENNQDFRLDSLTPLPLEPVEEEKHVWHEEGSMDDILKTLAPLNGHNTHYGKGKEQSSAAPQCVLGNNDFFKMIADDESIYKLSVVDEECSRSKEGGEPEEPHLIGLCRANSICDKAQSQNGDHTEDLEFLKAMGSDEVFLQLCKSDPLDFDGNEDVLFDSEHDG